MALIAGCGGNCNENAVAVVEQLRALGPTISTIEVYSDFNGDGAIGPTDLRERGFVIDPRATVRKAIRVVFLTPQDRSKLDFKNCALEDECDSFINFVSFVSPPAGEMWVDSIYFNDDPNDACDPNVTCLGNAVDVVTFELHDDLIDPILATEAIPVQVTLALNKLGPFDPFQFGFVLARQFGLGGEERIPPRIESFTPSPATPLPGWGRPITAADFAPGDTLADVLARADGNFLGATLAERVSPHQPLTLSFDDPMSSLVVSVTPFPATPSPMDPAGIALDAPTVAFFTPFTTATSDTDVGMAPDRVYRIEPMVDNDTVLIPFLRGTQSDQGQFLIPDFNNTLYESLLSSGYSNLDLTGSPSYTFRTGPFRLVAPRHHGSTNRTSSPSGQLTIQMQFALPAEGIAAPTQMITTVSPTGQAPTTSTSLFPGGAPDSITQDGVPTRSGDVTVHAVTIPVPQDDFDDLVTIRTEVSDSTGTVLGSDSITFHHDVIAPTIDAALLRFENVATDGYLNEMCLTADCDLEAIQIATTTRLCSPLLSCASGMQCVSGRCVRELSVSTAQVGECTDGRREYCLEDVPLDLINQVEDETEISVFAVDDQGNRSEAATTRAPRPVCTSYDKFVGANGKQSSVVTTADGTPAVVWADDLTLRFAQPQLAPAVSAGRWSRNQETLARIDAGHTFGVGVDMILDPLVQRPVVCYVDASVDADGDGEADTTLTEAVGTLHIIQQDDAGAWSELSIRSDVQPLGCTLSTFGTLTIVGWLEHGVPMWSFAFAVDRLANALPFIASDQVPDQMFDLDLAGHDTRIWFAYRTRGSLSSNHGIGTIITGYTDVPGLVTNVTSDLDGAVPQITVDDGGLLLAYITDPTSTFDEGPKLLIKRASLPPPGDQIHLAFLYSNDDLPAVHALQDGFTPTDRDGEPLGSVVMPFSRPGLVRDGQRLVVAWLRGEPGAEEVVVASVNATTGTSALTVMDRRVETDVSDRGEAIPTNLAMGQSGYFLVYRNPAAGELAFASEKDTIALSGQSPRFECGLAWQSTRLTVPELNMTYAVADSLWDNSCTGFISPAPPRPARAGGEEIAAPGSTLLADFIAPQDTLLNEGENLLLRQGRVPLRPQRFVCVPGFIDSSGPFEFSSVCDDPNATGAPTTQQCGVEGNSCQSGSECCSGTCRLGTCTAAPTASGCPADPADAAERGVMPWILTADGTGCTRCLPGAAPHSCRTSADCLIFGGPAAENATQSNARCAAAGWDHRPNAPVGRVCVPRCQTDADCYGGACDLSDPNDPGVCRNANGDEAPPGVELLCRPLGCDQCWRNDFCNPDVPTTCPAGHICVAEQRDTPACVLRPILAASLSSSAPAEARAALDLARSSLQELLSQIEIPRRIDIDPSFPLPGCELTGFATKVLDLRIEEAGPAVKMVIEMEKATFTLCGDFLHSYQTAGNWSIRLTFAPFIGPATQTQNSLSALDFSLVDVRVIGELDNVGPNLTLNALSKPLEPVIRKFANDAMKTIVAALGASRVDPNSGLRTLPDVTRCMFVAPDQVGNIPRQCRVTGSVQEIWSAYMDVNMFINSEPCP